MSAGSGSGSRSNAGSRSVSVVIPVLRDAIALEGALGALARQTIEPLEVVVVDNAPPGPADADVARVARAAGARVVREPRPGVAAATAAGFDAAAGAILGRLDADSRPGPGWVAAVAERLSGDRWHAVTGPGRFDDLAAPVGRLADLGYRAALVVGVGAAMGGLPLWGSTAAIRRDAWLAARDRIHRHDPTVHDDLDLSFALGPLARIGWEPRMRVGVEARTFRTPAALATRIRRTMRTCRLHWARQGPGERLLCRATRGRLFHDPVVAVVGAPARGG